MAIQKRPIGMKAHEVKYVMRRAIEPILWHKVIKLLKTYVLIKFAELLFNQRSACPQRAYNFYMLTNLNVNEVIKNGK